MFNPRAFKKRQAAYWDAAAGEVDQSAAALLGPVVDHLLDAVNLLPGQHVLDLACGSGTGTLRAARRTGPSGMATGIDLSAKMIEQARANASRFGVHNARFATGDAEQLELPERSFDAAICQLGLALFPNAVAALREASRVLKPGGRIALTAIGRAENSSFFLVPARVAAKHLPTVVVNEGGPTQLAYAAEGAMEAVLSSAGFKGVWCRRFIVLFSLFDVDVYWELFRRGVGGFAYRLARERVEDQQKVVQEVKAWFGQNVTDGGLRLPLEIVMGGGARPHDIQSAPVGPSLKTWFDHSVQGVSAIPFEQLDEFRKTGKVIDVRQSSEVLAAPFPATHLPRGRLEEDIQSVVPDTRTPVLCCCTDGFRSALAARVLRGMGYRKAAFLEGGMTNLPRVQLGGAP